MRQIIHTNWDLFFSVWTVIQNQFNSARLIQEQDLVQFVEITYSHGELCIVKNAYGLHV